MIRSFRDNSSALNSKYPKFAGLMEASLFYLIIAVFAALLILNLYFRIKVLKVYKYLVQNKVQFGWNHFLNNQKMEEEILLRYPEHQMQIKRFVQLIRQSVLLASILLTIILVFGYILMKFR